VKLLDYKKDWAYLESSDNPFAVAVMAHLKTLETRKDKQSRLQYKLALSRRLYQYGWTRDDIIRLYRFIDWIMVLPAEMENIYHEKLMDYERKVNMQYITTAERIGMEKGKRLGWTEGKAEGKAEGILESLQTVLDVKFGADGAQVYKRIRRIRKPDRLMGILAAVKTAKSPEDVLKAVQRKK
jgi:hypothetical protein